MTKTPFVHLTPCTYMQTWMILILRSQKEGGQDKFHLQKIVKGQYQFPDLIKETSTLRTANSCRDDNVHSDNAIKASHICSIIHAD